MRKAAKLVKLSEVDRSKKKISVALSHLHSLPWVLFDISFTRIQERMESLCTRSGGDKGARIWSIKIGGDQRRVPHAEKKILHRQMKREVAEKCCEQRCFRAGEVYKRAPFCCQTLQGSLRWMSGLGPAPFLTPGSSTAWLPHFPLRAMELIVGELGIMMQKLIPGRLTDFGPSSHMWHRTEVVLWAVTHIFRTALTVSPHAALRLWCAS